MSLSESREFVRQRTERATRYQQNEPMNHDRIQGKWKKIRGYLRAHWGELIQDPLRVAAGKREQRDGRVQELRGVKTEAARLELEDFLRRHRHWDNTGL
jgi:uncharacterized protein YjbJ (UPF0337 family)